MSKRTLYKLVKKGKEKNSQWQEIVYVNDRKISCYHCFVQFPFCRDGYGREGITKGLEKRGWMIGIGGLIYKKDLSFVKIIDCLIYTGAYKDIYEFLVGTNPLATVHANTSDFLNFVDIRVRFKKRNEQYPEKIGLIPFLELMEFSSVST